MTSGRTEGRPPRAAAPTRSRRIVLTLAAILLILVAAAQITLETVVDRAFVEGKLQQALGGEGCVIVTVGDCETGFLLGSFAVADVDVRPVSADPARSPAFTGTVRRFELAGIDRWTLAVHRGLKVSRLVVDQPDIQLARRDGAAPRPGSGTTTPFPERLGDLPPLAADSLAVVMARFAMDGAGLDLHGVTITAAGVDVSSDAARDDSRTLFCRRLAVTLPANRWQMSDKTYELGPLTYSSGDSSLVVAHLAVVPRASAATDYAGILDHRVPGTQLAAGPIDLRGVRWRGGFWDPSVEVRDGRVHAFALHVYSVPDTTGTTSTTPRAMPHRRFQSLGAQLTVDHLLLDNAGIRYSERPESGGRPGSILFAAVQGTISNLSNDPAWMSAENPLLLQVGATLADTATLRVHLIQDLASRPVDASVVGDLVHMPASGFNSILEPLEGVEFTAGGLDTMHFAYTLRDLDARGQATASFRGVTVRIVGRDRQSGPIEAVTTLLGNLLKLRHDASDGAATDSLLTRTIHYTREPRDTYIKFVWAGLRSGMKSLIGV